MGKMLAPGAHRLVIDGLVVGLYQPLADDQGEPRVRPNLSLAVASKDKEKSFKCFLFNLW